MFHISSPLPDSSTPPRSPRNEPSRSPREGSNSKFRLNLSRKSNGERSPRGDSKDVDN